MRESKFTRPKIHQILSLLLAVLTIIFLVFYGSLPVSYDYEEGSIAEQDIYAPRTFVDEYDTEIKAIEARESVGSIYTRSEDVSEKCMEDMRSLFSLLKQERVLSKPSTSVQVPPKTSESVERFLTKLEQSSIDITLSAKDVEVFFELKENNTFKMSDATFNLIEEKATAYTERIMMVKVFEADIPTLIEAFTKDFSEENPSVSTKYVNAMSAILKAGIYENAEYDVDKTKDAATNAYLAVKDDPIMITKGTKLVAAGEEIDEHVYSNLVELELIRDTAFDFVIFARVAVFVLVIAVCTGVYLNVERKKFRIDTPVFYLLLVTFLISIGASVYLSTISQLLCIVVFFTVVCATYLGTQDGIILSAVNLLLVWPMYGYNTEVLLINLVGIFLCAIFAGRTDKIINNASLIFFPTIATIATSLSYSFLVGSTRSELLNSLVYSFLSCISSLVAAIGLSPIFELVSNAASPVKLISLSQPGQALLKRLFLEASGTHSHSMMVANLADSAAESIGADPLLCKVAAYYHDIGKLENPLYFTENQHDGINPHDNLTTMESVAIITKHPEDGVKLAKKERLPNAIVKIIDEHHGTTYPSYFYRKAVEEAKMKGLESPDINNFRYRGHIPSSKESAIVMIADTCEAAIRSTKTNDVNNAEKLIRALIKDKIDQDQLINSGLSFDDLEKIVVAFKQVYAGVFHERIKYPE